MHTIIRKAGSLTLSLSIVLGSFAPLVTPAVALAADTGFLTPTATHTPNNWGTPLNVTTSNDVYATSSVEAAEQGYATFNFAAIPGDSGIDGIEVKIEAKSSDTSGCQIEAALSYNNGSNYTSIKAASLTGSDAVYTLGGATDTWGRAWDPSEFTNANFVLKISFDDNSGNNCQSSTISVDQIQVKVYHSPTQAQLVVDTINGQPYDGFCIAGPLTLTGHGIRGTNGGPYSLDIGNGNGGTTTISVGSGADGAFTFGPTLFTPINPGSGLYINLYHGSPSGQDSHFFTINVCTAQPTQGVVVIAKQVVNDNGGIASPSDFTLTINGNNVTGSSTGAMPGVVLNPGSYQITETGPAGYTQSNFSCTVNGNATTTSNNTIQVYAGKNYVCTVTNDDEAPTVGTLKIIKHVINNNGGTATAGQWSMSPGASSTPVSAAGSETGVDFILSPGAYDVSESGGPSGYTMSTSTDCTGTIAAGQTKTCTVTNDDQQSTLTVTKEVTNIRKTNVAGDFNLLVGVTSVVTGIGQLFNAGTYTVSETNGAGYNTSFSGDCDSNGSITLGLGQTKACTITNTEKTPGTLHIIKVVQNDNPSGFEGTATPGQFTLSVTGGNPSPSSVVGTDAPGADVIIDAGAAYSVTETGGPSGYGVSYSADCSTTMPEGGEKTCTVTNNDNSPTQAFVTVVKQVNNDNGGTALASAWTLQLTDSGDNDTVVSNGIATLFAPDTYTIGETGGPSGYSQTSVMCSTDGGQAVSGASLTVEAGHSYVCTITNDDNAPTLNLVKEVTNDNGGEAVAADWTLGAVGPTSISGAGGAVSGGAFQAGTYTLSESSGPDGYTAGEWSCTGVENDGNQITLGLGESATCTIVNDDQPGTLHVVKTVVNDNGGTATADDFSFKVNNGSSIQFEIDGINDVSVDAGAYSVTEDSASGYGATLGEECSGIIANGEEKTCIITNDDGKATLNVVKHTIGANGTFGFTLTGQDDFTMTTVDGWATSTIAINGGNYDVIEDEIPAGWTFSGASCVYDNQSIGESIQNGESISVDPGDEVTCTFTNTATGADLAVVKTVDDNTPDNGQQITFTLTATNAGPAGTTGAMVTDLLPSGLTYVSDNGAGAYASSTGTWTIGSLAAGASASLQIVATVTAGAGTTVTNTASTSLADENVNDYDSTDNTGSVSVTVNTPTPPPSGGGGGGGGGGNGPISTIVPNNAPGIVLGASTDECVEYLTSYIKYGRANNSAQVVKLQEFLNNFEANNLAVTGTYDQASLAAVHAFQTKYLADIMIPWGASKSSGYVYYTTKKKINEIYCKFTKQFPLSSDQEAEIARYRASGQAYVAPSTPATNSGVGAGVTLPAVAPAAPKAPAAPAVNEEATIGGTPSSQAASPATAPATGNWWTNFWDWVFGK